MAAHAPLLWLRFTLRGDVGAKQPLYLAAVQINELTLPVEALPGAAIVGENLFLPTLAVGGE
jgi:hypothetical protein